MNATENPSQKPERRRRRGAILEAAILDEVWTQLHTISYDDFMIDAVARASGTSRAVLYRRWPNKAALVHAAILSRTGTITDDIPDTGSFAGDIRSMLHTLAGRIAYIGADVLIGLLSALDDLSDEVTGTVPRVVDQLVERARKRGEIGTGNIPGIVLELPTTLLRYRMISERSVPSDAAIDDIVDRVFIPLVQHYAPSYGGRA